MAFSMFPTLQHLTYEPWIWLKLTSLSSTASVLKDGRISNGIPFKKLFFFKTSKWDNFSHTLITCKCLNGSEEPSGLNDLFRHDNINGLNDLFRHDNINGLNDQQPLWPQKNQKLLSLYTISDIPGIRILSSLNDLNSLNNLSGLNDLCSLISSKNL